jgi:GNAT superfamily N-acetyltransferase
LDETALSRIEDASLNASAPPQQRWSDGWLGRTCPGRARRARSVDAVAAGRLSIDDKLALAAAVFAEACLPLFVITRAGGVLACGQVAREGAYAGLYDIATARPARGQGLATALCKRMLSLSAR